MLFDDNFAEEKYDLYEEFSENKIGKIFTMFR